MKKKKVLLALSGGIDSAMAAFLLKEKYDLKAIHFLLKKQSLDEIKKLKKLTNKLKIPLIIKDERKNFQQKVITTFLKYKKELKTFNPCVFCNRYFKFNLLIKETLKEKFDFIATGHYARIKKEQLFRGRDKIKDQSFFLAYLNKNFLKKIIFPLGNKTKKEIKILAQKEGLSNFISSQESQDLCFVENNLTSFLKEKLPLIYFQSGDFVEEKSKKVLASHKGLAVYTLGQRARISGEREPLFVTGFDKKNNFVLVGKEKDLFCNYLQIENCSWLIKNNDQQEKEVLVQIRHQGKAKKAKLCIMPFKKAIIKFKNPIKAITPGQFAAVFKNQQVLGGGFISLSETINLSVNKIPSK